EGEAHVVDARVALRLDADGAVGPLPRADALEAVCAGERRGEHAAAERPRRVAGETGREPERVRAAWSELCRDHRPTVAAAPAAPRAVGRGRDPRRPGYAHPMLRRAAGRVSLRSRERKMRLFLETFAPGPDTTVVDVGVTDAPFGGGSSDNFFEAMYPWPERITAVGRTELDRFAAAFPAVTVVRSDGRELPFADGAFDLGFSNAVVEHVAGGPGGQRRFVDELCRVARRVFVTT